MAIKRRVLAKDGSLQPVICGTSTVLCQFPLLLEFLACRQYDDGEVRQSGYMRIMPLAHEWEITLYDRDAACRLPLREKTLDDALASAELHLGAAEAPWEPDSYLEDVRNKKMKKKK